MMRATVFGPGDNVMAAMMEGERVIPTKPTDMAHIAMKLPTGASGTIKGGEFMPVADESADRDLNNYRVAFVDGFDPDILLPEDLANLGVLGEDDEPLLQAAMNDILGISSKFSKTKGMEFESVSNSRLHTALKDNMFVEKEEMLKIFKKLDIDLK